MMEHIYNDLKNLREKGALVHCITNYVAMNINANTLLSIGASPLMSHARSELGEIAAISSCLVNNIGTLDDNWRPSFLEASKFYVEQEKPIILDPVGSGASKLRTQTCLDIINGSKKLIIRGNASEIQSLVDQNKISSKGVDSSIESHAAIESGKILSKENDCVVFISGGDDFIIHDDKITKISNGSSIMTKVTAIGCSLSCIVGAFATVGESLYKSAISSAAIFSIAGELAASKSEGPGDFQVNFLEQIK
jgi:hydroxyethylthiazole kinase